MIKKEKLFFTYMLIITLALFSVSCEKEETVEAGETITDIDGNIYKTVKIGKQVWMAENLKTTKYNDGVLIPNITDNIEWGNDKDGAYCWYDNDKAEYEVKYGALYNWYAVNTAKVCPTGWHVPTENEFKELERFLGMSNEGIEETGLRGDNEGGELKSVEGWYDGGNGIDTYGFNALPGGYRSSSNQFYRRKKFGYWWSSTEFSETHSWYRSLFHHSSQIGRYANMEKQIGFSVRCIKDK